jgi:hypothetical protein
MKITINETDERTVYPDIDDNLTQPEGQRFAVVMKKPSAFRLAKATRKQTVVNGDIVVENDWTGMLRAYVKELRKAPELQFGETSRTMTVDDLFEYDELSPIVNALTGAITEMRKTEGDDSPKN